jgi:ATP-dependent helicase/nuclease subunit B
VLDVLGSPYSARRPSSRAASAWRLAVRRLGIRAGWLQWRKLEARAATGVTIEEPGEPARELVSAADTAALWTAVSSWQARLSKPPSSWADLAREARELLAAELVLPSDATVEERAAFEAVGAAVASLSAFDRLSLPPSWEAFLDALERKLRAATLDAPRGRGGVRALGVMDARGEGFRATILLGLKERAFPRQIHEDPLLRESARAALRHPAGYWIRPKRDGYEEERLLFYLAASSARDKLVCVFPRSDESGKAEVPSLYLRELCRAAGIELASARRVPRLPFEKLDSEPLERLSPREASLRLCAAGADAAAYGRAVGLPGDSLEACLDVLPELARRGAPGRLDGVIDPPKAFLAALKERGLSPTALDELASCPFRFFAHRLLGLGGIEEPSSQGEIAPWLRGKVYHEALEHFYADLPEAVYGGQAAWRPALTAALERVFSRRGWRDLGVYPVLWRAERARIEAALESFLAWDLADLRARAMRPLWREKELKGAVAAAAGLVVRGVIDRVDADAAGRRLRVVDYKTTWRNPKKLLALVRDGEHHQLPLYAELAAREVGAAVEEASILALEESAETTGRERAHALGAKELSQSADAFYDGLARRVEGLARGVLTISPDDGEHGRCSYCDFPALCRKSHAASRSRAKEAA